MPWIRWIDEDKATGELKDLFSRCGTRFGMDHILKIHSLNPESLEHHYQLYQHRAEREMIAVVVSKTNDCFY
jgi:hypothetical protein